MDDFGRYDYCGSHNVCRCIGIVILTYLFSASAQTPLSISSSLLLVLSLAWPLLFLRPWYTQTPVPPDLWRLLAGHIGLLGRCSGMSNSKELGAMAPYRGTATGTSHHSLSPWSLFSLSLSFSFLSLLLSCSLDSLVAVGYGVW